MLPSPVKAMYLLKDLEQVLAYLYSHVEQVLAYLHSHVELQVLAYLPDRGVEHEQMLAYVHSHVELVLVYHCFHTDVEQLLLDIQRHCRSKHYDRIMII